MGIVAISSPTQDVRPEPRETLSRPLTHTSYLAVALTSAVLATTSDFAGLSHRWFSWPAQAHDQLQLVGLCGTLALALGFVAVSVSGRAATLLASSRVVWGLWAAGLGLYLGAYATTSARLMLAAIMLQIAGLALFVVCVCRSRAWRSVTAVAGMWPSFVLACVGVVSFLVSSVVGTARGVAGNAAFDRRLMLIATWGFAVPAAWAVSSLVLPRLMRLKPVRTRLLLAACILDLVGVAVALAGHIHVAVVLLLHATFLVPSALRLFSKGLEPGELPHPVFVRLAYIVWLRVGATLAVWASVHDRAGIWSSSQHAMIVGFISSLVLAMGEPLLSVFSDIAKKPHKGLALGSLVCLNAGCLLHVVCEILSSQGYLPWLRQLLPLAALAEMAAFAVFAFQAAIALSANRNRAGRGNRAYSAVQA